MSEERKLGPIARAFYDGFASSSAKRNGSHLPLEVGSVFDAAFKYAQERGEVESASDEADL